MSLTVYDDAVAATLLDGMLAVVAVTPAIAPLATRLASVDL